MSLFIKDVVDKLENLIPPDLQEDWDNSGYQVKLSNSPVTGIVTSLDLSKKSLDLSLKTNSNLILIHHPLFFHPLRFIDLNSASGRFSEVLINNKICVYALHTNFDSSLYSMSRYIMNKLSAKEIMPLVSWKRNLYKLSVFIPKGYVKTVRKALFKYGNPKIGNYENCSFETKGKGSFKPLSCSDPFIGKSGKTSFVDESKVEILIEEKFIKQAVEEMKKVHPYEEAAYDIFPLFDCGGKETGAGAAGNLENAATLGEILENIRDIFSPVFINYCGRLNKKIKKIAVVSGSGFSFIDNAIKAGCDLLISSELKHSTAIKANISGISLIEMSHFDTEKYFTEITKDIILKEFNSNIPVFENNGENSPINKFK